MKVAIDQLKTHGDNRGVVFEPIEADSIHAQQNCHVVISKPGAVRGNHYHFHGTETIAVMGPAHFKFREGNDVYDFDVPAGQAYRFVIPPNVAHAVKNTGKEDIVLIAFNTVPHDREKPDVIGEILI